MMVSLYSECIFFYLVRVLKLNSLGITQTRALTLTYLLYAMSLNKITDSNKAHTCLFTCTLSNLFPSSFSVTHSLFLPVSASLWKYHHVCTGSVLWPGCNILESLLLKFNQTERNLSPRAILRLRCTAWAVNGYMPCSGVNCGICGPFCLSGEK